MKNVSVNQLTNNRNNQVRALATIVVVGLCLVAWVDAAALSPRVELDGRIRVAGGSVVERVIAPGAVLHTGDEVRLKVTPWIDGHLYVISLGSSGNATLLHPYLEHLATPAQGGAVSAPVHAGKSIVIPADGGFLPLDDHVGREMIVAFVTEQPVEALSRLMFRMEGVSKDPSAARTVLVSAGYELAHISFGHEQQSAVAATSRNLLAGAKKQLESKPATQAQEAGVLAGLGSRIAQFTGHSKAPQRTFSNATAVESQSTSKEEVVAGVDPPHESTPSGSGSIFGSWFDSKRETPPLEAESRQPARTFALPAERQVSQQMKQRELASTSRSETQNLVPAPSASSERGLAKPPSPATATGRLVEPSPVEATLYSADRSSPAVRTSDRQPTGLSADGRTQSTLSRLFTSESKAAQDVLAVAPPTNVTAQADSQVSESSAQRAAPPTAVARSRLNSVVSEPRLAQEQSDVVAEIRATTPAPQVRSHDQPTEIAPVSDVDTPSESDGFFSGLTALFSAGDSDKPQIDVAVEDEPTPSPSVESERPSEPAPLLAVAATEQAQLSAPVPAAAQVRTTPPLLPKSEPVRVPEAVVLPVARPSTVAGDRAVDSTTQSSGLLSGLTALFSAGDSDKPQIDVAVEDEPTPSPSVESERPSEPAPLLAVAATEQAQLSAPVPAAVQ
ncbi:MAG: hypothetical protein ACI8W7_004193, partial [Gammaproteobacteria bacterium]